MRAIIYDETLTGLKCWPRRALIALGTTIGLWQASYPAVSWYDALTWLAYHAERPWTSITLWVPDQDGLWDVMVHGAPMLAGSELDRLVTAVLRVSSARCVFRTAPWPFGRSGRIEWRVTPLQVERRQPWVQ